MKTPVFNLHHLGRFGNMCMGYLFARGYCEKYGFELHTDPWIGERIFALSHPRCTEELARRDENTLAFGEGNVSYRSYSQQQKCTLYTETKVRQWLAFRPEVQDVLEQIVPQVIPCCAHRRVGDYPDLGYVVVSKHSYEHFAMLYGIPEITWVTEETPLLDDRFQGELAFLPDFYRLINCEILLRGNSTFSWIAGVLTEGRVFSPVISGLAGGKEHDVQFVRGNHPRFANLEFTTDLHLLP